MHTLNVDFRNSLGRRVVSDTLVLIAHPPEREPAGPTPLELAKAQPGAQMMEQSMALVRETNKVNLELTRFMIEDSRAVREINADQRKNEIDQLGKMVAKVSDGLSTMTRPVDPLTALIKSPLAVKAGGWAAAQAMAAVAKHGGPAEAAKAIVGHFVGRAAAGTAADTIKPLMEKGMQAVMGHAASKTAKVQAEAKVATAEANARKAEAEMQKAQAELALAEAKMAAAEVDHQRAQAANAPTAAPPPRRVEPHLEVPRRAPKAAPDRQVFDVEAVVDG